MNTENEKNNKIIFGDFMEKTKDLPEWFFDMCLTDVPYGVNFKWWNYDDSKEYVFSNYIQWLERIYFLIKEWSHAYIFVPTLEIEKWVEGVKKVWFNFNNMLATRTYTTNRYIKNNFKFDLQLVLYLSKWKAKRLNQVDWIKTSESWKKDKRNQSPKEYTYHYPSFVMEGFSNVKWNSKTKNIHWNEKNIDFCKSLIQLWSNKGELVFDPFAGSWTTAIASYLTDRKFFVYEKSEVNYKYLLEKTSKYFSI